MRAYASNFSAEDLSLPVQLGEEQAASEKKSQQAGESGKGLKAAAPQPERPTNAQDLEFDLEASVEQQRKQASARRELIDNLALARGVFAETRQQNDVANSMLAHGLARVFLGPDAPEEQVAALAKRCRVTVESAVSQHNKFDSMVLDANDLVNQMEDVIGRGLKGSRTAFGLDGGASSMRREHGGESKDALLISKFEPHYAALKETVGQKTNDKEAYEMLALLAEKVTGQPRASLELITLIEKCKQPFMTSLKLKGQQPQVALGNIIGIIRRTWTNRPATSARKVA